MENRCWTGSTGTCAANAHGTDQRGDGGFPVINNPAGSRKGGKHGPKHVPWEFVEGFGDVGAEPGSSLAEAAVGLHEKTGDHVGVVGAAFADASRSDFAAPRAQPVESGLDTDARPKPVEHGEHRGGS